MYHRINTKKQIMLPIARLGIETEIVDKKTNTKDSVIYFPARIGRNSSFNLPVEPSYTPLN